MMSDEIRWQWPGGVTNEDEYCGLITHLLGAPAEYADRVKAVLAGDDPAPLFDEGGAAPADLAGRHYWFLVYLAAVIKAPAGDLGPVVLPAPADVESNPLAYLAQRGHTFARAIYDVTGYEYPWPQIMRDDLDLTRDALAMIEAVATRFNRSAPAEHAQVLHWCFAPSDKTDPLAMCFNLSFRWYDFVDLWRRAHGLGGGLRR